MPTAPTGRPDRSGSDPLRKGRISDADARALDDGLPADDADDADDLDVDDSTGTADLTDTAEVEDEDALPDEDAEGEDDDEAASGTTLTKRRTKTAAGATTSTTQARSKTRTKPERRGRERTGNPFVRLARFIREVVGEMRKVLWPTRRELGVYTVAVIIFVTVLVAIVGGLDFGFARLVLLIFG